MTREPMQMGRWVSVAWEQITFGGSCATDIAVSSITKSCSRHGARGEGADAASTLEEFVAKPGGLGLHGSWFPAAAVQANLDELSSLLEPGDIIINGGNDEVDAETSPLRDPWAYQYDINLTDVAEVWRRGSVVASWLLDLTADALARSPELEEFTGRVSDSGEGRWTVLVAVETGAPASVLATALFGRFVAQGEATFANKLLAAMRSEFGGHDEKTP